MLDEPLNEVNEQILNESTKGVNVMRSHGA